MTESIPIGHSKNAARNPYPRDTYASQLLTAGFPVEWVARPLGHASTQVTEQHYARYLGRGGEEYVYVEPARPEPGEIPADVLARLHENPERRAVGDPYALPASLRPLG